MGNGADNNGGKASPRFSGCVRRLNCRKGGCMGGMKKYMNKATFYLMLWVLWMIGGTLYYSYVNHLGVSVGFYQAINIGYSIGYGYPREPMEQNWWFSSAYVVLGASFVGVALGFFADKIVEDSQDWFTHMMEKQQYEIDTASDKPLRIRMRAHIKANWTLIRSILLWLAWITIMITYSMASVKWPFSAAQYFAISTCSTGGHMPIPDDSPLWLFGLTGIFAAIGVPLMGVAMASLGSLLMEKRDDLDDLKKIIEADVTAEELLDLQRFGLEDGDGEIDKAEFIILCMVRLGTDPRLVQFISKEFQKLDDDNSNSLSILEITRGRVSCDDLQKLSQSESYRNSRRLSGAKDDMGSRVSLQSLSSIPETHDHDEENQKGAKPQAGKVDAAKEEVNENVTAETECEAIPEEDHDDDAAHGEETLENDFHDTFEDNEDQFHESQGGIFF
eukprot:CAMPEP_0113546324 /NCGR_PEP_ID=MMETSP0015_2-20120614/11742_1 /TAXON_ID=2838 /ORGANISM="Odontella" /LENGTH=445 /DNA_ID=CAMNT_0000446765 /DNA_START=353 /DNA_END=1690 /DNA_ORIENTATION=- /assembly_acc=CAM_ASM_000160